MVAFGKPETILEGSLQTYTNHVGTTDFGGALPLVPVRAHRAVLVCPGAEESTTVAGMQDGWMEQASTAATAAWWASGAFAPAAGGTLIFEFS